MPLEGNLAPAIPAGTSIVTRVERAGKSGGSGGVVTFTPPRHDGRYRVRFADGSQAEFSRSEISSRRRSLDELIDKSMPSADEWRERVAYECVVGSVAFGTDSEESDVDVRGFFVAPPDAFAGLRQLLPPAQIDGEKDPETHKPLPGEDWTYWEIGKYVELLLNANPSIQETLYTPHVLATSEIAEALREERHIFLSRKIGSTYAGYVLSQMERMERQVHRNARRWEKWEEKRERALEADQPVPAPPDCPRTVDPRNYRGKHAMHLIRLIHSGAHALRTGEVMVRVPDELRDELIELRTNRPPIDEVRQYAQDLIRTVFEPAMEASSLPDDPDWERANELLLWSRRQAPQLVRLRPRVTVPADVKAAAARRA